VEFVSHLEEFRRRLIICIGVFLASVLLCFFFCEPLLDFLLIPLRQFHDADLYFHKPYEAFLTQLKVSAAAGFVLSSPVFFTQLWLFVAPGLYDSEKKILFPLIFISALLFFGGAFFAYRIVLPLGLNFLLSFQTENLKPLLTIGPYFSFLIGMVLAFGFLFDLPVILIGLIRLGIVNTKTIARWRKMIVMMIFIAAAILTPPDPVSQILLAFPLLILFEVSLFVGRWLEKKWLRESSSYLTSSIT